VKTTANRDISLGLLRGRVVVVVDTVRGDRTRTFH
jgi:hypothetical protein